MEKIYFSGPPDPTNPFKIDFNHNKIYGIDNTWGECKSRFNKSIISLESEDIKKSFLDILKQNGENFFLLYSTHREIFIPKAGHIIF